MDRKQTRNENRRSSSASGVSRRRFIGASAGIVASTAFCGLNGALAANSDLGLPQALIDAARREGELVPYEPFPSEQSKPMAESFTAQFGIPNKFFRAGQEALQARVEAEARAGQVLADTIGQSDIDVVQDMVDRGLIDTTSKPTFWNEYPEQWRYPHLNNVAFAVLSCNMIYNKQLVAAADSPKTWQDLVSPRWKGKVVIPSPEYAGTGFALLAEWVRRYGWDFIRALKANNTFIVQAVSASDSRVIAGQSLIGIVNSHRGNTLLGQNAPVSLVWSRETPPVALSYVHAIFKKAPHPNAARLYRDYCLTAKVQSDQAAFGLWGPHPKATQPAHLPALKEVALVSLDWDYVKKNRTSLLTGWKTIMSS